MQRMFFLFSTLPAPGNRTRLVPGALLLASVCLALPGAAWALSLNDARAKGVVCETTTGLVQANVADEDVAKLVEETNARRLQAYKAEASRHGVSVSEIQGVSALQLRERHTPCP